MTMIGQFETAPAMPARTGTLSRRLSAMPLHRRFAMVGSVVSLMGMLVIGSLVSEKIESSVVRNSAISSAVYMESVIAPLSQDLERASRLSPEKVERMRALLERRPLSDRILSVKIWRPGGVLAFSSDPDLIGHSFEASDHLKAAWRGELNASFDQLDDAENARERMTGVPLLEVYNPIHSIGTGEIIAVAEFYMDATELENDLRAAHTVSWATVGMVTALTFGALFGIVRAGSRTIAQQNQELTERLDELARVSRQNNALRERVQAASRAASETNERYMRRISAELHDGPAQALALASLRLDSLMQRASLPRDDTEVVELRTTLGEALSDVRDLCRGLTLPELDGRTLAETLELAVSAHERRTGGTVERAFSADAPLDQRAPHPILICVYRFVQEGLMNAYRHADAKGQRVACWQEGDRLFVLVSDDGPGLAAMSANGSGLGLAGLRERVESIGGEFQIDSLRGRGTQLTMSLAHEGWS